MLITTDLKTRLTREFFAHLVSQLKSAMKPAPSGSTIGQNEQSPAILEAKFEANIAHYGRMRMAALQT
jgi:hypothetical protein